MSNSTAICFAENDRLKIKFRNLTPTTAENLISFDYLIAGEIRVNRASESDLRIHQPSSNSQRLTGMALGRD